MLPEPISARGSGGKTPKIPGWQVGLRLPYLMGSRAVFEAPWGRDMRLTASLVISQSLQACDVSGVSEASFRRKAL